MTTDCVDIQVDINSTNVIELKNNFGQPKFNTLTKIINYALTLSHGNNDIQGSLSQNNKIFTENCFRH